MFGPNKVINADVHNTSTHRSNSFKELYKKVLDAFRNKWPVLNDYEIVFLPGSGTVGIESVISSIKAPIISPANKGRFAEKWIKMNELYQQTKDTSLTPVNFEVHFETSLSTFNKLENVSIVDGISSFPYYEMPSGTDFFITCSNKQIGSLVGLSIVFIKKDKVQLLQPTNVSYLNLMQYVERAQEGQSPTTFPEFQLHYLLEVINNLNLKNHNDYIDEISSLILKKVPKEFIVGDCNNSPCISISQSFFNSDVKDVLYKNDYTKSYQIFTYSHSKTDYINFLNLI